MPANQALRCICCTASSFFACRSEACPRTGHRGVSVAPRHRSSPVGARLAREQGTAVYLLYRVIVLRRQAWLLQRTRHCGVSVVPRYRSSPVGARLAREQGTAVYLLYCVIVLRRQAWLLQRTRRRGVSVVPRYRSSPASLAPTANKALRCICCTASSFFAGKLGSYNGCIVQFVTRGSRGMPSARSAMTLRWISLLPP
ncbi:hypothetical protein PS903_04476 [Pseudomonas fluorescens]|nr:hypothetical protein PS903_04476 [Pseudomonas fluorescens]